MKKKSSESILGFFKGHPKYPFENYFKDYDEYAAAYIMAMNLIKSYILESELDDWHYASDYYDYRRNDPDLRTSLISCINEKREQVFFFAINDSRDEKEDTSELKIYVERSDFYGGKWEFNLPEDEWYSVFQVEINLRMLQNYMKLDKVLDLYFSEKHSFVELEKIKTLYSDPLF